MAVFETDVVRTWDKSALPQESTVEERQPAAYADPFALIETILGYDIREEQLMVEGYRELGSESLRLATDYFAASAETLPPTE